MDDSIPGPSQPSSQKLLKRQNSRVKSASKRRKLDERSFERVEDDDAYQNTLSQATKETVLKLKKISDPFQAELQSVVDDVFNHFEEQSGGDVDLAESALLLSSVTQVYSAQVKSLHADVLAIANRLSGKEEKIRQRKKAEKGENPDGGEEIKNKSEKGKESSEENSTTTNGESPDQRKDCEGVVVEVESATDPEKGSEINQSTNDEVACQEKVPGEEICSLEGEPGSESTPVENQVAGLGETQVGETKLTPDQGEPLETEILQEIPSRCTRRQSERLRNILNLEKNVDKERNYTLKKRKFDDDPPTLISSITEWNEILEFNKINGDLNCDDILPPVLEIQVGRRRKKIALNNNEGDHGEGGCDACHADRAEPDGEPKEEGPQDKDREGCKEEGGKQGDFSLNQQYETLDHLPNDVQERFHGLIQEMYKLPFDYTLMQKDMFAAYQQKFLQAVSLLSQNSVLVKKGAEKEGLPKAIMERSESVFSESDATISSIGELLNQVRLQAAEEYNKGKQSKSDAEVPVSQMIATLKRIICKRYKKWHARTDCDREVFNRIKDFEEKVKSVLKREADQGLFDVKKYEMEVMDVTLKESVDGEQEDLLQLPLSPLPLTDGEFTQSLQDLNAWAMPGTSRRSSVIDSVDGSCNWMKMNDIFSHMKKIDNSETCRHFYAVLGLLSHQNLSINYDNLFSQESAKVISKVFRKSKQVQDPNSITKYPVGAKIMNSRCPDSGEVLVAPVFSSDTIRQLLEQDGYLSSSGYQSDEQGSSTSTTIPGSFSQSKTIQDAISEFVVDEGDPLPDHYLNITRRKKR